MGVGGITRSCVEGRRGIWVGRPDNMLFMHVII